MRKLITEDDRIGRSHSFVTEERGFGGHCLPKDTLATTRSSQVELPLLESVLKYNDKIKK